MLTLEKIGIEDQDTIAQAAALEAAIFPDPWSEHEIANTIRQKHTFCAVAREGEEVCGYFLCYYVLDECEIARIAVDESERRQGTGGRLLDYMEEICREKQITRIMLEVRRSNRVAIIFYEKHGFEIDGERKHFYGGETPEDAVLMSKYLSGKR